MNTSTHAESRTVARATIGTVALVAEFFGVDVQTVVRWAKAGRISHGKLGREYRFTEDNVAEFWVKKQTTVSGSSRANAIEEAKDLWNDFLLRVDLNQHNGKKIPDADLQSEISELRGRVEDLERICGMTPFTRKAA